MTVDTLCRCAREQSAAAGKCSTAWTLVGALQRKGRKVSVVSTMFTQPPMISDNFRRQADHFIDLITSRSELDAPDRTYAAYGRYPMKPRSMPEFTRRKHNDNSLLAPSRPECRRARSTMLWPSWSTTHEMFTDSRVFATRNRYFRLQSLSRSQFTLAPRGVSGFAPQT